MEQKIGSVIKCDGDSYLVVINPQEMCEGCHWNKKEICSLIGTKMEPRFGNCAATSRMDHQNIIYALIAEGLSLSEEVKDPDLVNHPSHYTSHPSGVECIDIAKHHNFCVGNSIKYLWRCGLKIEEGKTVLESEIKDLQKAGKYIEFEINRLMNEKVK
jgi:hypothetical protein